MIHVYVRKGVLIAHDRGDKQFIVDYGAGWEKVADIRDARNCDVVIPRLVKQYGIGEVVRDCKKVKRLGWKYMTSEERVRTVEAVKAANTGRARTDEVKRKISATMKGRPSNSKGHVKDALARKMIAVARLGKDPIQGRKWAYCSATGDEKRLYELPEGWKWGRTPELKDWLKR